MVVSHSDSMWQESHPLIKTISKGQLTSVVNRCFQHAPSDDEVDAFLSGSLDGELSNP